MVYLITGATGYIGSLLIKRIIRTNEYMEGNVVIIGLVRNKEIAQRIYQYCKNDHLLFLEADIRCIQYEDIQHFLFKSKIAHIDYLFHCAATTKSSMMISNPVETADGIILGTKNILETAKNLHIKSIVYLSSMEVYGRIAENSNRVTEEMIGDVSVLSLRSCYPLGKRMAENYCFCYYSEYELPVKIARLAQVFGNGVLKTDTRIFAQIARAVLNEEDIILHTAGDSFGNFIDADDAVDALFLLLEKGKNGEAYNIVNEKNTMRIYEMAELAAKHLGNGKTKVIYDIPEGNPYGYAVSTGLRLSGEKICNLGWHPKTNLIDMYRKTLREIREYQ